MSYQMFIIFNSEFNKRKLFLVRDYLFVYLYKIA